MRNLFKHIRFGINSTIGKNIISLYFLLASYYILPLITVPYLVRMLGPEKFGLVAFGQSLITFFVMFVNFGFDLTGTRTISINRESIEDVSRISCSIWIAKALLALLALTVLATLITFVPKMNQSSMLFIILFGIPLGNMLFPNWLFLGLERMKAISVINITMRLVTTISIFVFIRNPDDYLIYAGILSFQWVFAGISGVWYATTRLKIRINIPEISDISQVISDSWRIFVSHIGHSIYYSGNSFILGVLTNYTLVGYYSAAEKITLALIGLFRPVAQAVYPRFSQLASSSKNSVLFWGKRMVFVMGGLGLIASLSLFIGAQILVKIILGKGYGPSVTVLQILSILPFVVALSDVFSNQIMLPFSKDSFYTLIRVCTALLHIVLALLIVPRFQENGMAFVFVISELFILISSFVILWYLELTPFQYRKEESTRHNPLDQESGSGVEMHVISEAAVDNSSKN